MEDVKSLVLHNRIAELEAENKSLKLQLQLKLTPYISSEEMICIEQISLLKEASANRQLSLDEIKRLDLLIKNVRIVRGENKPIDVENTSSTEAELLALVVNSTDNE